MKKLFVSLILVSLFTPSAFARDTFTKCRAKKQSPEHCRKKALDEIDALIDYDKKIELAKKLGISDSMPTYINAVQQIVSKDGSACMQREVIAAAHDAVAIRDARMYGLGILDKCQGRDEFFRAYEKSVAELAPDEKNQICNSRQKNDRPIASCAKLK